MSDEEHKPKQLRISNYDAELSSSLTIKRKVDKGAKAERGKLIRKQKSDVSLIPNFRVPYFSLG